MAGSSHQVTGLLLAWGRGDEAALNQLIPLVHDELRRIAADRNAHATVEGGHIPFRVNDEIRTIVDWFDKSLGPVAP